jgi:hypothetical protein
VTGLVALTFVLALPATPELPNANEWDIYRFPDIAMCHLAMAWNTAELQRLEWMPYQYPELRDYRTELLECRRVWEALETARIANLPGRELNKELHYLDTLMSLIGPDNFYAGRLPPPVPVWRLPLVE